MRNIVKLTVQGLTRYRMDDGTDGCNVFATAPTEDTSGNRIGMEVMKFSAPFALLDTVRAAVFPCEMEAEVNLRMGAGGKAAMFVVSLNPVSKSPNSQPGNPSSGNSAPKP